MKLSSSNLAPINTQDLGQARFTLEAGIKQDRVDIAICDVLLANLTGVKTLNKKYFDACRAALPGLSVSAEPTTALSEHDTTRKIKIMFQGGYEFDLDNYRRNRPENPPIRQRNTYYDLKTTRWMDSEPMPHYGLKDGITMLRTEIETRLKNKQESLESNEKSLANLDAYATQYNAAAAKIKALLEELPPLDWSVRDLFPLATH